MNLTINLENGLLITRLYTRQEEWRHVSRSLREMPRLPESTGPIVGIPFDTGRKGAFHICIYNTDVLSRDGTDFTEWFYDLM